MRYLIGTGNRNWNDPNIWSLTSGGAPYRPESGTEKIPNIADREFSSDTGFWTKTGQSTISSGAANIISNNGSYSSIAKYGLLTIGKTYKLTFYADFITGGIDLTETFNTSVVFSTGSKTIYGVATNINLVLKRFGICNIIIDNISIQEVDTIAPDSTTNCIFDANSGTGTITVNSIANMLDFTCSNIGALTLANAAYAFNVYGSLTLHTNLTVTFTSTGYLFLKAVESRTITTNGKVANWNRMYFDGVGGTWTLQDNFSIGSADIYLKNGHFNSNSKTVACTLINTEAGTKILTLGSSIVTIYAFANNNNTGFTFNYNTSTLIITGTNVDVTGISQCYNLTFTRAGSQNINLAANRIVDNNLTINGYNDNNSRALIASNTIGTPRTITCNGTVTASNVDFRDITLAGTCNKDLSAITGGSGDCGGNSGITFTTAQSQYFKKYAATANYGDAANWFSDLALTVAGRVPLPQDLGSKFLATSFNQTCTVSCNVPRIPCLDMSEVVNTVTWSLANAVEVYGSYVLGNNIVSNGFFSTIFHGRGNFNINGFGKIIIYPNFNSFGGNYTIISGFSFFQWVHNSGTKICNCGNNIFNCLGISSTVMFLQSSVYFKADTSTFFLAPSGSLDVLISGNGCAFNKIQFSGSHTGNFDISGSNTIAELIIDSGRKVRFLAGTTQTIGKLTAIGTLAAPITLESVTAGSRFNLTYTGVNASTVEYCSIKDSKVNQARRLLAKNSTNVGNNQNWGFDTLPPFALNTKQVDKIYYGSNQVAAMYIGNTKIY